MCTSAVQRNKILPAFGLQCLCHSQLLPWWNSSQTGRTCVTCLLMWGYALNYKNRRRKIKKYVDGTKQVMRLYAQRNMKARCHGKARCIFKYSVCLCSCLHYPTYKPYIFCSLLYRHLWPFRLYSIFTHYHIKDNIFVKKIYWTLNTVFARVISAPAYFAHPNF